MLLHTCLLTLQVLLLIHSCQHLCAEGGDHHHHQITKLSHSINAIGPAPHRSGKKREHPSIVFATITHIPSLHKIRRNAPRYHPTNPLATPNIIRNKTQQLDELGDVMTMERPGP
jgi:hypothetical protein